jgi:hypothetical protein
MSAPWIDEVVRELSDIELCEAAAGLAQSVHSENHILRKLHEKTKGLSIGDASFASGIIRIAPFLARELGVRYLKAVQEGRAKPRPIEILERIEMKSDQPMWEDFTIEELQIMLPRAKEDYRRQRILNAINHLSWKKNKTTT